MSKLRPKLNEVPVPNPIFERGKVYITVSPGQWDNLIKAFYEAGKTLLEVEEVNGKEKIVRAYRKEIVTTVA